MSENLLIKEGQIGRKFSPVDRLRVNNQGGGSSLWRNAEELEMDSLEVTENGLYLALDEDLYAYDTITVDVQEASEEEKKTGKTVVGKDQTTGDDHAVGVDEDGNLTEERVPSAIKIVVLPAKRKYVIGEQLNYTGIHVYLMDANNNIFTCDAYPTGEIPFDELVFPASTATESSGVVTEIPVEFDDLPSDLAPFPIGKSNRSVREYIENNTHQFQIMQTSIACNWFMLIDNDHASQGEYHKIIFIASAKEPFTYGWGYFDDSSSTPSTTLNCGDWTYGNKTVYYAFLSTSTSNPTVSVSLPYIVHDIFQGSNGKIAWLMHYGSIDEGGDVPVQWIRPQDGETLEDTFEIEIVAEPDPDPIPEPEPDPYADHYDFEYQGAKYNFNRSEIRQMSYSGGYVLVMYMDTMQTYTVADALKYNLIVRVSSTHTGGDF